VETISLIITTRSDLHTVLAKMESDKNNGYTYSGNLNIRFVINCEGETGRYIIHKNDLNLIPKKFDHKLKEQLFKLT
jgi:hypothetical protein